MEDKIQIKEKEINGKTYKIGTKIYLLENEIKEIVIACHGFTGDKESSAIESLANELYKNNIGVICFDFPGHGKSQVASDKLTIENCIQDINDIEDFVIQNFGNIPINIFATSFGAYITLINIAINNKKYKNIILRSPAIKMKQIFKNNLLKQSFQSYKSEGYTILGFERKMKVSFDFYKQLENYDIFKIYKQISIPKINIIQGDKDDIAPIEDTINFLNQHKDNINLYIIPGADHRMKGSGELAKAIKYSKEIILK